MGFADCLSPDSPCENCNCCFIAASTSVHFFYFFYFLFCCFFTSSSFSSYSPPPSLFLLLCFASFSSMALACRLAFSRCPNTAAQKATSLNTPLPPSRSIVLLINPRTATLVPERPTTPLDPQANVRKFGVTRTHTSRVKNKAKEQRGLIACTRRTIVFSLPPHKAGRKPSDTESAGACPSRCLHLGRRRTHASTEGLAVPPLNELS